MLPREFFGRAAQEVAPDLLGCLLVHDSPAGLVAAVIVETEAYAGQADPASHAYGGPTARNAVMFGPPGHAYVYFSYGMHFCVNLVCRPAGEASAVLLRAARVVAGADLAAARRSAGRRTPVTGRALARGPGRLCQALGIDRAHDGADVCAPASPLRACAPGSLPAPGGGPASVDAAMADGAAAGLASGAAGPAVVSRAAGGISRGPRVGISRAAEVPWRFWLAGEPCVSAYRPVTARRPKGQTGYRS
ncbi:MAG: DNA-3-methyladenine glycosylase [Streptosporangiaceae bacterium]